MWRVPVSIVALAVTTVYGSQTSPQSLMAAAGAGPRSFVQALASHRQPAGLVIRESGTRGEDRQRIAPQVTEDSVEMAMAAFNGQAHEYQASLVDGVILLTPQTVPDHVRRLLARRYQPSGRTASFEVAMLEITKLIDPGWGANGIAGSGPMPGKGCQQLLEQNVTLRGTASVQELLGSVTKQVPGVAWTLVYDDSHSSTFWLGFVCLDGSTARWSLEPK